MQTVNLVPIPIKPVSEQSIEINGVVIGMVKNMVGNPAYNYHAILNSCHPWSIYQGFGVTIDEAMRNAVEVNRDRRLLELVELEKLENLIWGDNEPNE